MIKASFLSRALFIVIVLFTLVVVTAVPINSQMMNPVTTTTTTNNISNATSATINDTNASLLAPTTLTKPSSLEREHEEVHKTLATIVESSGNTAAVAKQVRTLMQPHFEKEEQLSIPVLGALLPYVEGTLSPEAKNQAIEIANMFKQEYKNMLNEHKQIVVALNNLSKTASMEDRQDALAFIEQLKAHAMNEEQVTYPATIVIGDLLQVK